jgi:hypothetical protein
VQALTSSGRAGQKSVKTLLLNNPKVKPINLWSNTLEINNQQAEKIAEVFIKYD